MKIMKKKVKDKYMQSDFMLLSGIKNKVEHDKQK